MSQRKKTALVGGVAILSVAGILSKIIGMCFRLPLANMIGPSGMGIYQAVYPFYTLLLTISTSGIPVAISRLVSESITLGKHKQARVILRVALMVLVPLGAVLMCLLILFSQPLATRTGDSAAAMGLVVIAPSILLVSIMSAFRGYMQGRSRMVPTAISQLIEQVAKVLISFPLAALGMGTSVVHAAAGALLGITCGEALALLFMMFTYLRRRKEFASEEAMDYHQPETKRSLASQIIRIAIPITIGSMIVPIAASIDTAMIRTRLMSIGFTTEAARELYGLLSGYVISLINVPTSLAMAVCIGLVPAISSARIDNRTAEMHETSRMGLRLASLIGFPCALGLSQLSSEIIRLLYGKLDPAQVSTAGGILAISAWTILLFTHVQASTGILQGAGMHKVPMYSLVAGVACKVFLNYVLIGVPSINIYGAPIASLTCYAVSLGVNLYWIIRKTGMRFDIGSIVVRPALATLGMGVAVYLATLVLDMSRRTNTLLAVLAGGLVYAVLIFLVGALRRKDMEQVPGGAKIERLMCKLHIWR